MAKYSANVSHNIGTKKNGIAFGAGKYERGTQYFWTASSII